MLKAKDMISSIENFVDALISTRHIDELDMWVAIHFFAEKKANRLRALDAQRNR